MSTRKEKPVRSTVPKKDTATKKEIKHKETAPRKAKDAEQKLAPAGYKEAADRTTGADRSDKRKTSWKGRTDENDVEI